MKTESDKKILKINDISEMVFELRLKSDVRAGLKSYIFGVLYNHVLTEREKVIILEKIEEIKKDKNNFSLR